MLPSIFGENLFDEFFANPFGMVNTAPAEEALYGKHSRNLMKTDVREMDNSYELDVDLPGFKKDEITVDLKNGYLTIGASKGLDNQRRSLPRREGSCFYSYSPSGYRPCRVISFRAAMTTGLSAA